MTYPKQRFVWLAVACVVVLGLGGAYALVSRASSKPVAAAAPKPALTVTATTPRRLSWPTTVNAWGAIAAWQEAVIGAQVGGYSLTEVRVNVGDQVQRGQLLARINSEQLAAETAQLKAALAEAQATAAEAEANRQRILSLGDSGGISRQEVLQYVTKADTAKAQVESARATLAVKELQLRDTDVLAPDSGTISARNATLGAVVSVGQELFRLIRQNRLEWRGELTAAQLAQVKPGQIVHLVLPDGTAVEARVRQISPSLDVNSRLGMVYADLSGTSNARAGMYGNGQINIADNAAWVIPAASVVIRDGNSYVLALQDKQDLSKVTLTPVTVGQRQGDQVEITHGVTAASRVVVQGAGFLNDGNLVRVVAAGTSNTLGG